MKKTLLLGSQGQIGWDLHRLLGKDALALDRSQLDLSDLDAVRKCVREVKPEIILNAAAYTAVDKAESEAELAITINGEAPGVLAEEAKKLGALLVHYSTDYVFNGTKKEAYVETDATDPINVYGKSKLAGEKAIQESGCNHLILRTSWVYANRGKNFVQTMLKLGKERDQLRVVSDQHGIPNSSTALAQHTITILQQFKPELSGIYHLSALDPTTWHDFAEFIFSEYHKLHPDFHIPIVHSITSENYPTPAKRPFNSVLNTNKIRYNFRITLQNWKRELQNCLLSNSKKP